MENRDLSKLKDSELTPEELARREKRREKRRNQRAKKQENDSNKNTQTTKPVQDAKEKKVMPKKLTNEEFEQQKIQLKLKKIERNPRASVVIYAESPEARTIAYKVDEVNMISDYTRTNMGTSKVSFDAGIELIKMFHEDIEKNLEDFIMKAASHGIGNRDAIKKYKGLKQQEIQKQNKINKLIANETEEETKNRELKEKALEKAKAEIEKAETALEKAQELKEKTEKDLEDFFNELASIQKIRKEAEKQKEVITQTESTPDDKEKK